LAARYRWAQAQVDAHQAAHPDATVTVWAEDEHRLGLLPLTCLVWARWAVESQLPSAGVGSFQIVPLRPVSDSRSVVYFVYPNASDAHTPVGARVSWVRLPGPLQLFDVPSYA
jgi:hypothetical protein